ncbi:MAG: polysaccharide deacetylase family protein [Gallionella sp.]|nr:polysaccharide deacetylase family protein [Gallionella sp.]
MPERRSCGRLSIVTFHRVLPETERQAYPFPGLVVTPEELDAFLTYFTEHFDCGTLATQHERYLSGEITARPLLALTFDDAQHDNYKNARPVLARHRVKASFFVPVKAVERQELLWHDCLGFAILTLLKHAHDGRERMMQVLAAAGLPAIDPRNLVSNVVEASKRLTLDARLHLVEALAETSGAPPSPEFARLMSFEEIAELAADGHEIGSHSMTHCLMPECDDRALTYEVAESRHVLQDRLGLPVETFCYPNGNSDVRTARAVAQAGYRRAVTTAWGNNGQEADRFQLHRYDMVAKRTQDSTGKFVPALLAFRMSGYYPGLG